MEPAVAHLYAVAILGGAFIVGLSCIMAGVMVSKALDAHSNATSVATSTLAQAVLAGPYRKPADVR
jgi:hypothetical protein